MMSSAPKTAVELTPTREAKYVHINCCFWRWVLTREPAGRMETTTLTSGRKKKWLFETPVTVGSIYWRSDIMRTLRRDTTPDAGSRDILIEYIVCWEGTISCFIYNRGIQEGTSGAFLSLFQTPVQRAIHRDTRLAKLTTELTLHPFHTVWVENLCIYISQWCAQGGQQGQSPLLVAQLLKNVR